MTQTPKKYKYKQPKKPNGKNNTGRPDKYKPEYCKLIIDYFDIEPYSEKSSMQSFNEKTGAEKEYTKTRPTDFPTFEGFAASIDVDDDTLENRTKSYPEFFGAYRKAKALQKKLLLQNGLNGLYKEGFAKFVAINCFPEMKDRASYEHTGKDGGPIEIIDLKGKTMKELELIRQSLLNKK